MEAFRSPSLASKLAFKRGFPGVAPEQPAVVGVSSAQVRL